MSDLIERLEGFLARRRGMMSVSDERLVKETITALREKDKALKACLWHSEEDEKEIAHLQARITELDELRNHFEVKFSEQCQINLALKAKIDQYEQVLEDIANENFIDLSNPGSQASVMRRYARTELARIRDE